ncbi:innexin inx2-like [Centruroides vittatus]|uniref:innexin inx2-like n=1 Tax=Centruroides vittatus TaxID=120091 RepID=UPI00350F74A4
MDKIFLTDALRGIIKIKRITIDNAVFRLHYRATTLLFITFSILVTATQFFGDPIRCIQRDDIPERVINTYCWIESTFTLPKALTKKVGEEVVYPGVDKHKNGDEVIEHAYYQWVCFVLFLQGLLFYVPRILWKAWEGGKINALVMEMHKPVMKKEDREDKCKQLASYFSDNWHRHNGYAFRFFICEFLNFVNVVGQIYLVDRFLGGEFTTYGPEVVKFAQMNQEDRFDPMIKVFPRMAKCTFHRFGSAGSVQTHDALCILPLNIVNEKIYVFIWFWMVILAIITGGNVAYRILVFGWPRLRFVLLRNKNIIADKKDIEVIMKEIQFGDWFILYLLSSNMHSLHFREFMSMLAEKINLKRLENKGLDVLDSGDLGKRKKSLEALEGAALV